jgi:hypothetical protein
VLDLRGFDEPIIPVILGKMRPQGIGLLDA